MLTAFLLGVFHGANPAMGWLFAVALGLQERRRTAVLAAFAPIAAGHLLATAAALAAIYPLRVYLGGGDVLRFVVAAILIGFGVFHLRRARHPKWGGMRIGAAGLVFWSFLAATAHGAGFMLAPFVAFESGHGGHLAAAGGAWLFAAVVHTAGFFLAMAALALLVYEKLGVALLRRAWINMDLIWAGALILVGVLIPFF